jgi:hypothetical protein
MSESHSRWNFHAEGKRTWQRLIVSPVNTEITSESTSNQFNTSFSPTGLKATALAMSPTAVDIRMAF